MRKKAKISKARSSCKLKPGQLGAVISSTIAKDEDVIDTNVAAPTTTLNEESMSAKRVLENVMEPFS